MQLRTHASSCLPHSRQTFPIARTHGDVSPNGLCIVSRARRCAAPPSNGMRCAALCCNNGK
eukprot:1877925-Lingulodinium_polyedra.AAC.1